MNHLGRFRFIGLFCIVVLAEVQAQSGYTGVRAALFDVEILQQKSQQLQLRCRIANTGRVSLGGKKTPSELLLELDSVALPALLRCHEQELSAALSKQCPKLQPGEISDPIWLEVKLKPREMVPSEFCAELVFDTVFVESWETRSMQIRYYLRNKGKAPAYLYAKGLEPLVNAYFVSGTKLTRGAIPAGSSSLKKGRETLDGVLLPGQILEGRLSIDLKGRSQFSPNIALELDPAQAIDECGRTGNIWVVLWRF